MSPRRREPSTTVAAPPINSATTRPAADTLVILRLRWHGNPNGRCSPGCRGWFFDAETDVPNTCDECNALARARGAHTIADDDLMVVPRIRRALARRIAPVSLREFELERALRDVLTWTASATHAGAEGDVQAVYDAIDGIDERAREALS